MPRKSRPAPRKAKARRGAIASAIRRGPRSAPSMPAIPSMVAEPVIGAVEPVLASPAGPMRFRIVLSSSVRGDIERRGAPTRAAAFEVMRALSTEALAREAEQRWLHGETVSVRVEQDLGV